MKWNILWIFLIYLWTFSNAYYIKSFINKPPPAKHGFNFGFVQQDEIEDELDSWSPEDGTNIWEHSGLYEGDIMLYKNQQSVKNGLIDKMTKWPEATIPYYIDEAFTEEDTLSILNAMQEYHNLTCIRFRPYVMTDENWIDIKSDYSGCWSSVGMQSMGQVVNLGSQKCRRHGVIIHELLHAIGFYHQQSAAERDNYIKIYWENIKRGREHNFNKYNESVVTNFNVSYDYDSVMHYSGKAFSKNGEITIEPIYELANLGQRIGLSEKDILKINAMYEQECNNSTNSVSEAYQQMQMQLQEVAPSPISENYLSILVRWFESLLSFDEWNKKLALFLHI